MKLVIFLYIVSSLLCFTVFIKEIKRVTYDRGYADCLGKRFN